MEQMAVEWGGWEHEQKPLMWLPFMGNFKLSRKSSYLKPVECEQQEQPWTTMSMTPAVSYHTLPPFSKYPVLLYHTGFSIFVSVNFPKGQIKSSWETHERMSPQLELSAKKEPMD